MEPELNLNGSNWTLLSNFCKASHFHILPFCDDVRVVPPLIEAARACVAVFQKLVSWSTHSLKRCLLKG